MAFSDLVSNVRSGAGPTRFNVSMAYNDVSISCEVEYGKEGDGEGGSVKDEATIYPKVSDVADPDYRDTVVIGSVTWRVSKIVETESLSHHAIEIETSERPVV